MQSLLYVFAYESKRLSKQLLKKPLVEYSYNFFFFFPIEI